MDAKEYLLKIDQICVDAKMNCDNCPLKKYACGIESEESKIDTEIKIVEDYKPKGEPMKIIVEAEVPDGETCHNCNFIYYTKCWRYSWITYPAVLAGVVLYQQT